MAKRKKLDEKIVTDYEAADVYLAANAFYNWRRRPPFHRLFHVPAMLADPRVELGLGILKGMITSLARFYVDEGDDSDTPSDVKQFVITQLERWWRIGANRVLQAMEWGWVGAETIYRINRKGHFCFHDLQTFQARDVYPVTLDGELAGIEVRHRAQPQFLGGEKGFWHVHWRHKHRWWGGSRLQGAFDPWLDLHDEGGALDVRRLYYFKYVFQGEKIFHPPGSHTDSQGNSIPYAVLARRMAEKARAGGVYTFPSQFDPVSGKRLWDVEDRHSGDSSKDVREYVQDLRRELTEGIGLAEEIFQAAETGSGFSGRKIPETAIRGLLTEIVYWMVHDADEQIIRPLVRRNFGVEPEYEIVPFGLVERDDAEDEPVTTPGSDVPDRAIDRASNQTAV